MDKMTTENNSNVAAKEDGDVHDADTGDYLFTIDEATGLPAKLQILHDGFWYVYTIDGRHKDEPEEIELPKDEEDTTVEADTALAKDISKIDLKDL